MLPFQFALIQQHFFYKLRVYNALCVATGTEGLLFKPASQTCRSLTVIVSGMTAVINLSESFHKDLSLSGSTRLLG